MLNILKNNNMFVIQHEDVGFGWGVGFRVIYRKIEANRSLRRTVQGER